MNESYELTLICCENEEYNPSFRFNTFEDLMDKVRFFIEQGYSVSINKEMESVPFT